MNCLTEEQIRTWRPYALAEDGLTPIERARRRMESSGQWAPWQAVGRRMAIGCVALEITQRCNLDCSLCYLSKSSEALKDIPLEEVYRRIDMIHAHYGLGTDVQVTGGDPTLRKREELVVIVRRIAERGMRPALFTNGIKASRDLLAELAEAGLVDVAFHVDLTQERKGYASEADLHELREEYIERARGLPINVIFNTTVFDHNFREIPDIVKFFVKHSDVVHMASFQLQADSGRGVLHERGFSINPDAVAEQIQAGAGAPINFHAASAGHRRCNRYAMTLTANGRVHDLTDDTGFVQAFMQQTAHLSFDRRDHNRDVAAVVRHALRHPSFALRGLRWVLRRAWQIKRDVLRARGRIGKLSLFIHNFMDVQHLEAERCEACSFMVMTPGGPLSMCVHNAKRDDYLLVATPVLRDGQIKFFNPATGQLQDDPPKKIDVQLTRKNARGRAKAELAVKHQAQSAEVQ